MCDYLESGQRADGQARILFDPEVFLASSSVKMFHYCARPLQSCMDAGVPGSRGSLIAELRQILAPLLEEKTPEQLRTAFEGQAGIKKDPIQKTKAKEPGKK
jgi:hypothetical protein